MKPSTKPHRIERKPVPPAAAASAPEKPPSSEQYDPLDDLIDGYLDQPPPYSLAPPPPPQPLQRQHTAPPLPQEHVGPRETSELVWDARGPLPQPQPPPPPSRQYSTPLLSNPSSENPLLHPTVSAPPETQAPAAAAPASARSLWKTAVDETVYFAGGLISRPSESTKHYSALRHSPGLVYYKGSSTSVAITIFSDAPLPPERTLWLQRRGYSGDLGMNAAALFGTSGNWIDVTPTFEAAAADVPESDERAWQRDIKRFVKKAAAHRHLSKQAARETCVVRIPAAAEDGYLRVLLCAGGGSRKVLCPSPVFRVASLSSDASVVRGASLATMPLEVGLKVASAVGERAVTHFLTPAAAVVQSRAKKLQPKFLAKEATRTALRENYQAVEQRYAPTRANTYDPLHPHPPPAPEFELLPDLVGSDDGPEPPFPLSLSGKVVRSTGQGGRETGIPTANLAGVPGDLLLRLGGIYLGWAAVRPKAGLDASLQGWHEALVTVGPSPYAAARVAPKNVATVHVIHDFGGPGTTFFDATLDVVVMAFLRPAPTPRLDWAALREEIIAAVARDVDLAVLSLARDTWQPEAAAQAMRAARGQQPRTFLDVAVEVRGQIQKGIDNVPVQRLGVRTTGDRLKDQVRGVGGMYIRR